MDSDIRIDGRVFAYVFPCAWEDYAKIGFSRDPLGRISALHRRWFEFFDLEAGALVEAESERDARDLELQLRRPFKLHRAPAPMTVQDKAGGHTEWVRGANAALAEAVQALAQQGYHTYPLRLWLRAAMVQRLAEPVPAAPDARQALRPANVPATSGSVTTRAAGTPATTAPDR